MRKIKFRALSMCKGERWAYGDLRHYARNPHTEKWTIHDPATGLETDIDETTIGQFVGLKDKNGKEVCEGDILKTAFSNKPFGVVTWHSDGYFFIDLNFGKLPISDGYRPFGEMLKVIYEDRPINIEVIGNIYDNPELIPYKDEQQ